MTHVSLRHEFRVMIQCLINSLSKDHLNPRVVCLTHTGGLRRRLPTAAYRYSDDVSDVSDVHPSSDFLSGWTVKPSPRTLRDLVSLLATFARRPGAVVRSKGPPDPLKPNQDEIGLLAFALSICPKA